MNNNELNNDELNEFDDNSIEENNKTYIEDLNNEQSYEEMESYNYSNNSSVSGYNNSIHQKEQLQNSFRRINQSQNAIQRLKQRNTNTLGKKVEANHSTSSNENEQDNNEQDNNNTKNELNPTNKLKNFGNNAKNTIKQKTKDAGKTITKGIANGIKTLATNPATAPAFWVIVGALILVIFVPVFISIFNSDSKDNGNSNNSSSSENTVNQSVNSTISLTNTDLSRDEFIAACNKRSETDSSHKLFYDKCGRIYDISIENNFNPEMVVIRAVSEGFSPGSIKNNYWGLGCVNTGGVNACISYSSFDEGVKAFIANVSQYRSVEDMMKRYAYIGNNWYNPGSWSVGGCKYFPYIRQYMSSTRASQVEGYCSSSKQCSGTACQPTNDEDQLAYSKYQVQVMYDHGVKIFGKVTGGIGGTFANGFAIRTANNKPNWLSAPDSNYYTKSISGDPFQCVWYAKARAYEIISTMSNANETRKQEAIDALFNTRGNGSQWYNNAISNTPFSIFEASNDYTKPRPGAMISWEWDSDRWARSKNVCSENCGHVAIIESVDEENRTVVISDGWKKCGNWNSLDCLGYGSRTVSFDNIPTFNNGGYVFKGYVYIADYVSGGN